MLRVGDIVAAKKDKKFYIISRILNNNGDKVSLTPLVDVGYSYLVLKPKEVIKIIDQRNVGGKSNKELLSIINEFGNEIFEENFSKQGEKRSGEQEVSGGVSKAASTERLTGQSASIERGPEIARAPKIIGTVFTDFSGPEIKRGDPVGGDHFSNGEGAPRGILLVHDPCLENTTT